VPWGVVSEHQTRFVPRHPGPVFSPALPRNPITPVKCLLQATLFPAPPRLETSTGWNRPIPGSSGSAQRREQRNRCHGTDDSGPAAEALPNLTWEELRGKPLTLDKRLWTPALAEGYGLN